jgi:hypothetical protein
VKTALLANELCQFPTEEKVVAGTVKIMHARKKKTDKTGSDCQINCRTEKSRLKESTSKKSKFTFRLALKRTTAISSVTKREMPTEDWLIRHLGRHRRGPTGPRAV